MTHLAAPAGLLIPTEWERCVEDIVAVDPDGSGAELGREGMRFLDVVRPNSSGETVDRVVGLGDGFSGDADSELRQCSGSAVKMLMMSTSNKFLS